MRGLTVALVLLVGLFSWVRGARILGVWSMSSRSHYILGNSLFKGLAEAGHDVALISAFEDKVPPTKGSYRDVVLTGFQAKLNSSSIFYTSRTNSQILRHLVGKMIEPQIDAFLADPNVKKLMGSGEKFDVVIVEQLFNDAVKALANHFNAHLIVFSPVHAMVDINEMVGNPMPLSYIPNLGSNFRPEMTFFQRTANTVFHLISESCLKFLYLPAQEKIMRKHFTQGPSVYDHFYNASLILLNGHESINNAVPLVPNMIPIGGYHVKPPKKLPQDLLKILDEATEGIVYVSMGSHLKSKEMPKLKHDIYLKTFGMLKETVLWKWEDNNLLGKPNNVLTRKWFPQADVLAHPNVKLFITHGGMLSTTETIYHGKPILAVPVMGDQISNAIAAENNGFGRTLPFHDPDWSIERFYSLIREMLDNPKYSQTEIETLS